MDDRLKPLEIAKNLYREKYSDADCFLLCGSTVRGDDTPYSDLDIVILYKSLKNAKRESFVYKRWPIEVFVHDLETLNYFFEKVDGPSNCPSLPQMVREGILISKESKFSENVKKLANTFLDEGPQKTDSVGINKLRYAITDLVDDIRNPRNSNELMATGGKLLEVLSEFLFKVNGSWSGKGKWCSRELKNINQQLEKDFFRAFDLLFSAKDPSATISLCEKVLLPHGGFLFNGFCLDAPSSWKLPIKKLTD